MAEIRGCVVTYREWLLGWHYRVSVPALMVWMVLWCGAPTVQAEPQEVSREPEIRLVLVIAVDQFRGDYLERFSPWLEGGLARLLETGLVYRDGHQHHAVTSTGPGHASIATGVYPARSGIISNGWFDRSKKETVNCVEDPYSPIVKTGYSASRNYAVSIPDKSGRSPAHLLVTTLPDWIKEAVPGSKVFAASRKDRGAILLGGKKADLAVWYDGDTGEFVSSTYYTLELPGWLKEFNRNRWPDQFFGKAWTPLIDISSSFDKAQVKVTDQGWFDKSFPHAIGGRSLKPNASFYSSFGSTPFMDNYLAELGRRIILEEGLGEDGTVDYLSLSFSTLDSAGHSYGPNSPEVLDTVIRLDRTLGEFFDFLEERIGMNHVLVALSSDHGVVDLPEVRSQAGLPGRRLGSQDILCLQRQGQAFLNATPDPSFNWFISSDYLNYEVLGHHNLKRSFIEDLYASALEECDFIQKVWTRTELLEASKSDADDHFLQLYLNSFHPDRSPDFLVQNEEYFLPSSGYGSTHGSPYRYDTHVPIIVAIPGTEPAKIDQLARTVDIAPTLADVLGIQTPPDL
ncbi:MAG TPA: alkaline phosphatase family protein, partial [Acidobacteriota bacterium]|nr:alkaline phosphatase family protein [Acidobacteriota bacterium]